MEEIKRDYILREVNDDVYEYWVYVDWELQIVVPWWKKELAEEYLAILTEARDNGELEKAVENLYNNWF